MTDAGEPMVAYPQKARSRALGDGPTMRCREESAGSWSAGGKATRRGRADELLPVPDHYAGASALRSADTRSRSEQLDDFLRPRAIPNAGLPRRMAQSPCAAAAEPNRPRRLSDIVRQDRGRRLAVVLALTRRGVIRPTACRPSPLAAPRRDRAAPLRGFSVTKPPFDIAAAFRNKAVALRASFLAIRDVTAHPTERGDQGEADWAA